LSLWNHLGDSIYGMFARCERMVGAAERLLEGEVYPYHSKMIMKAARVGGRERGTRTTVENGCLQVIRGSQALGRVDHVLTGEQAGTDRERVVGPEWVGASAVVDDLLL
jgi:ectoine hydroxylase